MKLSHLFLALIVLLPLVTSDVTTFYLAGGFNDTDDQFTAGDRLASVLKYDVTSNTFSQLQDLLEPTWGGKFSILHNYLYGSGNWNTTFNSARVERLRIGLFNSYRWKDVAPMDHPRADHFSVAAGDHIYVGSGYDNAGGARTSERYNPYVNTWEYIAPMSTARGYSQYIEFDDDVYVCGGWNNTDYVNDPIVLSSCEKYDTLRKRWIPFASMPGARYQGFAALNDAGTGFYIVGGHYFADPDNPFTGDSYLATSVYEYIVATDTWSIVSVLDDNVALKRRFCAGFVNDGHIYIFGGEDGPTYDQYTALTSCYKVNIVTGSITALTSLPGPRAEYGWALI